MSWTGLRGVLVGGLFLGALATGGAGPAEANVYGMCASSDAVTTAAAGVVEVLSSVGPRPETATGFAVAPGRVVTVAHTVVTAHDLRLTRADGSEPLPARALVVDERRDLALLDVPGLQLHALATAEGPQRPGACAGVLVDRAGRVQMIDGVARRSVQVTIDIPARATREAVELGADLRRGDSGAPVLDASGRVEGVVFAASRNGLPTGWAVSATELRGFLASSG